MLTIDSIEREFCSNGMSETVTITKTVPTGQSSSLPLSNWVPPIGVLPQWMTGRRSSLRPEKVVFNGPTTIVLWKDGTKTVVKNHGEIYDKEKALMAASLKKLLGNYTGFEKPFRKWMADDEA